MWPFHRNAGRFSTHTVNHPPAVETSAENTLVSKISGFSSPKVNMTVGEPQPGNQTGSQVEFSVKSVHIMSIFSDVLSVVCSATSKVDFLMNPDPVGCFCRMSEEKRLLCGWALCIVSVCDFPSPPSLHPDNTGVAATHSLRSPCLHSS